MDNEDVNTKSIEDIAKLLWKDNVERDPVSTDIIIIVVLLTDLFQNLIEKAKEIYKNTTDKIDIWVGGLLETTGTGPGQLFSYVIEDQFRRIRNGDRFWFENRNNR